jgi:hypothetical protein
MSRGGEELKERTSEIFHLLEDELRHTLGPFMDKTGYPSNFDRWQNPVVLNNKINIYNMLQLSHSLQNFSVWTKARDIAAIVEIQGGSDKSGPLSMLHNRNKK